MMEKQSLSELKMTLTRRQTESSCPILTMFRKLEDDETSYVNRSTKTVQNIPEPKSKSKKPSRSIFFCSLFPLSNKRGKLKISKLGSNVSLNRKMGKMELRLNRI
eukprot:GFUD01030164.1.p2 GENE.GFUD01030164.1~~GFUD01030164.1.p2  ORF type:complete len:114 (-),score=34.18 GFUD01030164.1:563-877(-)